MRERFSDRTHAGHELARALGALEDADDLLVLALPRGGVPVAAPVARAFEAPLDVFLVRKLGVPGHEELAFGAIATGGVRVTTPSVMHAMGVSDESMDRVVAREQAELERREQLYRGDRPMARVRDRHVVVVDDGLATGASMQAAVVALKKLEPRRVTVAVPIAAPESCDDMRKVADRVVCARTPEPFRAVGLWYERFDQTTDDEVREVLAEFHGPPRTASRPSAHR